MAIKVLLVDDEKDYILALARRLTVREFEVETAFGGNQALARLSNEAFDVVVLDVLMPEKDGIQTYQEINRKHPGIPVIMHTGHARLDTAIEEMKKGAFDYVVKPVELDELIDKINLAYGSRLAMLKNQRFPRKKPKLLSRWFKRFTGSQEL